MYFVPPPSRGLPGLQSEWAEQLEQLGPMLRSGAGKQGWAWEDSDDTPTGGLSFGGRTVSLKRLCFSL